MATRNKEIKLRATKDELFTLIKNNSGALLNGIVFADVTFFGEDSSDSSKIIIRVTERVDP